MEVSDIQSLFTDFYVPCWYRGAVEEKLILLEYAQLMMRNMRSTSIMVVF